MMPQAMRSQLAGWVKSELWSAPWLVEPSRIAPAATPNKSEDHGFMVASFCGSRHPPLLRPSNDLRQAGRWPVAGGPCADWRERQGRVELRRQRWRGFEHSGQHPLAKDVGRALAS